MSDELERICKEADFEGLRKTAKERSIRIAGIPTEARNEHLQHESRGLPLS
jgi:hypothetical protein